MKSIMVMLSCVENQIDPGGTLLSDEWSVYLSMSSTVATGPPHPRPLSREGERGEAGVSRPHCPPEPHSITSFRSIILG